MPSVQIKRGTRSQIETAAAFNGLKAGELYLITDEDRIAVGLSTSTFEESAKLGESPTLQTVEKNLGSIPVRSGRFTISGTGLVTGKPVFVVQASGPYTGKGTRSDEAERDHVSVTGKVINSTTIECFWNSATKVRGNFKFDYFLGA
jgi:hypothetical protein